MILEGDNGGDDYPLPKKNFKKRGRGRKGKIDRRTRDMGTKPPVGPSIKAKQSDDEEKICQFFLQGKCLKVKQIHFI